MLKISESDEKILKLIEKQDKYYVLGFINGIKAKRDELLKENEKLKNELRDTNCLINEYQAFVHKLAMTVKCDPHILLKSIENNWKKSNNDK